MGMSVLNCVRCSNDFACLHPSAVLLGFVSLLHTLELDKLSMPMPEAPSVTVEVTHPCRISKLRAKLGVRLDIPVEDVGYEAARPQRMAGFN